MGFDLAERLDRSVRRLHVMFMWGLRCCGWGGERGVVLGGGGGSNVRMGRGLCGACKGLCTLALVCCPRPSTALLLVLV
jgi:hypothetical protein